MARVVIENLTKLFRGAKGETIRAVSEVSLAIEPGELLALVGPTGCGKTTLLRLIAGLEDPTAGRILLGDADVTAAPPKDRDVAMVFQQHALYPHLTARENIAFGLKLRKHSRLEIERAVCEVAELLDLGDCLDRPPAELSGGQRQRVALARAIVRQPKVFLLDEPLSNLDAPMRVQVRAEIARLHRQLGATMIHVTHDQTEAMILGDRLAVMRAGVLQQAGAPLAVHRRPANVFVGGFIGSPPMNFFRGTLEADGDALRFQEHLDPGKATGRPFTVRPEAGACAKLARWKDKPVILGVRPEHFAECAPPTPAGQTIQGVVQAVERTGAETVVRLNSAAHPVVARLGAEASVSPGQQLALGVDPQHAHFFNPDTEERLG